MSHIQRQHALDFFVRADAHDYQGLADLLSENFVHRFFPASLKGFGQPSRNKQQFLELVGQLQESSVRYFNFQPPQEIIQSQDVVVLHLFCDGKTVSGKPYKNEYMFTFRFEGDSISSIHEFVDSKYVFEMIGESLKPAESSN